MNNPPLDPHKTILVFKVDGKEVGRIPATSPRAAAFAQEMARTYKGGTVDYEEDPTGGLLAALF